MEGCIRCRLINPAEDTVDQIPRATHGCQPGLFQTPSVSSQFVSLQASTLHDLPHLPRQTMDEFCPKFDRRVCQGGIYGPDASADTAPRFGGRLNKKKKKE